MEEKIFIPSRAGFPIGALLTRNDTLKQQKLVIIAGGYGTHKETPNQKARATFFKDLGYATLVFDRYGVGETGGDFLDTRPSRNLMDMEDIRSYIGALDWVKKDEIILFGNSYGGLLSFMEAARCPLYHKLILSAPALAYKDTLNGSHMPMWRAQKVMHILGTDRHIHFYDDMLTYDLDEMATRIQCPVLIIHGTQDKTVPFKRSQEIIKLIPNGQLVSLKGEGHTYNLNLAIQPMTDFLNG